LWFSFPTSGINQIEGISKLQSRQYAKPVP
jgi:hypothetical protein